MSNQIYLITENIADKLSNVKKMGKIYDQVLYIPNHVLHAHKEVESWGYPNGIQPGFIFGFNQNNEYFCRYWQWDTRAGVYLPFLRTLANSEKTPNENLFFFQFFEHKIVAKAMKELIGQNFQS